jgi:nucleoside-diphosphate-sugar epimerase
MIKVFLTGSTGFIGRNFMIAYSGIFDIIEYKRKDPIIIDANVVVHLAGKAEDVRSPFSHSEYYQVNTDFTKEVFDAFLLSEATVFIFVSSVKAVSDVVEGVLTEDFFGHPSSHYGISKKMAEIHIMNQNVPKDKRVYILRPCIIHGPEIKGNLLLLYKLVSKGIPWPLGAFNNERSYCSIINLMFIFKELIERSEIPSGVYNVADDTPLSTSDVVNILAVASNRRPRIWAIPKRLVIICAKLGGILNLPFNEERLQKLTYSYVVCNKKLTRSIGKSLPVSSKEGLLRTFSTVNR